MISSRNKQVLSLSLMNTIGKGSTVKGLDKLKIHKLFPKNKVCKNNWKKPKSDINSFHKTISRLAKYMSPYCIGILRVVVCNNAPFFQKARTQKGNTGSATLQQSWQFITLKNVQNIFMILQKE